MTSRTCFLTCLLAVVCLPSALGCGWFGNGDELVEEELSEDDLGEAAPLATAPAEAPAQSLALNLQPGDRFPLLKTVEQQLRQPSPAGWVNSHSTLEMLLSITVEEIYRGDPASQVQDPRDGQKRLQVRYHRIRFSQDLPGREVQYDSDNPPATIPFDALGYHGLKDNGFQFWIGADNQILEMVGFDQFLDRCLKDVAPTQRQQVRAVLAATSGADGIANFVDDSIGLLPANAVRPGDTWSRTRQILQPVPMHCTTQYTLRHLTPQVAEVDILGRISPSATYGPSNQPARDVNLVVRGGHSFGSCLIDRRTGLPVQSKVEQSMQMQVRLAGGLEFDQHKSTITTIRAFPDQGSSATPLPLPAPPVAGGSDPGGASRTAALEQPARR